MTDRELIELAAKAAGIEGEWMQDEDGGMPYLHNWENGCVFDPLTDDGDALRLAVELNFKISIPPVLGGRVDVVNFSGPIISIVEIPQEYDLNAATRRAIVRAAAEIGKAS